MSKSSYFKFSKNGLNKRLASIRPYIKEATNDVENLHVRISNSNSKLGGVPSVSLLPVFDCGNCAACKSSCYDLRNDLIYKETRTARAVNSAICAADMQRYFREITYWLTSHYPRAFRWHVGGDIKNAEYLAGMVDIATKHSDTTFLAFTKMFSVVNKYLDEGNAIPNNLRIIFSGWLGQETPNPYNLPSAHPIFGNGTTSAHDSAKLCTGNCTECLREKRLCWSVQDGEEIVFPVH